MAISNEQAQINLARWQRRSKATRINVPAADLVALNVFGNIWDVFVGPGWQNHARVISKGADVWPMQGSVTSAATFGGVIRAVNQ